ncbi:putative beta-glucosidase [Cutaneotrichosporon oleaginosum]|uniref:beta-glucosidase n=1 Tax=Cutaneotrichosporon oleaginosum TaxID=879819 RepID=A0A0J0XBA7_9TREE|nr:putative beta-glucosidase [Cutaneotrichosporon oleaginosum]KLT38343.1 putative beta-glucosidase [Cutaneotrichosporon oleaginosum]TXT09633.1 hypothetical protein COLE_03567 [Cutaneotrichosporon oleaginosum]
MINGTSASTPAAKATSAVSGIAHNSSSISATSISVASNTTASAASSIAPSSTTSADCTFCTVPPGYTAEDWPAPLHVADQFPPRWRDAHRKARTFLAGWSVQEKVDIVTGAGWMQGRCVGNTKPIPARNWTGLCLQDSPLGVRFADYVSAFPAGINAAATFDKRLLRDRGYAMGQEFKGKGINVALGPMTNMGRVAAGGRNWEGFGADPYLSGIATYETIIGMQKAGVQATTKHYIANEQERNRTTSSSNIDDRTMREIYAHPFLRAVQAHSAAFMCSYNLVNGSWASQNSKMINGILKTDWGYGGYIMSDWDATHSGVHGVLSGLDMDMPGDIGMNGGLTSYFGPNLTEAVRNGSVSVDRLDDMAQRIVAAWYLVGQDKGYPDVNFDSWKGQNEHVDVQDDHYKLIRLMGAASTVLLKNTDGALPLKKPRSIALIGEDMGPAPNGPNGFPDRGGISGTFAMGWGSGTTNFPYLVDPLQAISFRAQQDRSTLNWHLNNWDLAGAAKVASGADVALVGVNSVSGEQYITVNGNIGDRNNLSAWHNGDALIRAVAARNNNTVVVVHSVGPMSMDWVDHENITAVLWAGLPGQESGNALVDILWGAYNPSGRLPYTIAAKYTDYSAAIEYVNTNKPPQTNVNYTEGLFVDYRHFLKEDITPLFGFGFGLSYTSFAISNVQVMDRRKRVVEDDGESEKPVKIGRLMTRALHRKRWTVRADVTNTGGINGCEVPQLYLVYPPEAGEPPRVLRDFVRVNLDPGETTTVEFALSRYDVSIWDVERQEYVVPDGEYGVLVAKHAFEEEAAMGTFCPGRC